MDTAPLTYSINAAISVSGFSRADIYRKAGRGELKMVKNGRRTLVTAESLRRCIDALPVAKITSGRPLEVSPE